jgi:tetrahydromethanopterin S-methyltransferase subunit G
MMSRTKNEDVANPFHVENVRKELDAKIEKKISRDVFFWVVGTIIVILATVISFLASGYFECKDRLTKIETKFEYSQPPRLTPNK